MLNTTILTDFLIAVSGVSVAFGAGWWARQPVPPMSRNGSVADGIDEEPGSEKVGPMPRLKPGKLVRIAAAGCQFDAILTDVQLIPHRERYEIRSTDSRGFQEIESSNWTEAVVTFKSMGAVIKAS